MLEFTQILRTVWFLDPYGALPNAMAKAVLLAQREDQPLTQACIQFLTRWLVSGLTTRVMSSRIDSSSS